MSQKLRDWLIALGYVALVYSTLELARIPLAFLRAHGVLRLSLGFFFALTLFAIIRTLIQRQLTSPWKYMALVAVGFAYFFAARSVKILEEQIHFIEYGLAGVLFLRALRHHIKNVWKLWTGAFILASAAGWLDEILQGLTPHRHYDIRDVRLNAISVGLGLILAYILKPKKTPL